MLNEQQANELNIQQHALEAAEIGYNNAQAKLDKYDNLLNTIKDNYASYSPEQKERISSLMGQVSEEYEALKKQKQDYALAQYEAQQQINYYNNLAAQQVAPGQQISRNGKQRRRIIKPTDINAEQQINIKSNPFWEIQQRQQVPSINGQFVPNQNLKINGIDVNGLNIQTPSAYSMSPVTNNYGQGSVVGVSAPVIPQITNSRPTLSQGSIIPQEIQTVRNAYGRDYLRGMRDLEKMGYTIFNQKAYDKYGNVYNLYH